MPPDDDERRPTRGSPDTCGYAVNRNAFPINATTHGNFRRPPAYRPLAYRPLDRQPEAARGSPFATTSGTTFPCPFCWRPGSSAWPESGADELGDAPAC